MSDFCQMTLALYPVSYVIKEINDVENNGCINFYLLIIVLLGHLNMICVETPCWGSRALGQYSCFYDSCTFVLHACCSFTELHQTCQTAWSESLVSALQIPTFKFLKFYFFDKDFGNYVR